MNWSQIASISMYYQNVSKNTFYQYFTKNINFRCALVFLSKKNR